MIDALPATNIRPVMVERSQTVCGLGPVPVSVTEALPRSRVRPLELFDMKAPHVQFASFRISLPFVRVTVPVVRWELPGYNCQEPEGWSKVTSPVLLPAKSTVCVPGALETNAIGAEVGSTRV